MKEANAKVPRAQKEIKLTQEQEQRFWSKVNKNGPIAPHMETPCWIWTAGKWGRGYGQFCSGGTNRSAHRVSWTIVNGSIPNDCGINEIYVCHKCDVCECVNPEHLFLGTTQDNTKDREAKKRGNHTAKGEAHPLARLTNEKVIKIRYLSAVCGVSKSQIAKYFGMSRPLISFIISRKLWKHV